MTYTPDTYPDSTDTMRQAAIRYLLDADADGYDDPAERSHLRHAQALALLEIGEQLARIATVLEQSHALRLERGRTGPA